jgi:cation diffusion facilitator family transporter
MSPAQAKADLYRDATRVLWIGLLINTLLGVVKLTGGVMVGSFALLSDAVNSLGDVGTSTALLGAMWLAQRPADNEHPYGHTRAESVVGLGVAVMVAVSALLVGWETMRYWGEPSQSPPIWVLIVAAANVVIKEVLYRYTASVGERSNSLALSASAWDHRSDAFCSLAVLVGLLLVRFGDFGIADKVSALVVVAAIVVSAIKLCFECGHEMMDAQADDDFVKDVRLAAANVAGVAAIEKLFVRKTGMENLVDIHVQVDGEMSVADGHRIGHNVKKQLLQRFHTIRDVLVHLEPHADDEPASEARSVESQTSIASKSSSS